MCKRLHMKRSKELITKSKELYEKFEISFLLKNMHSYLATILDIQLQ